MLSNPVYDNTTNVTYALPAPNLQIVSSNHIPTNMVRHVIIFSIHFCLILFDLCLVVCAVFLYRYTLAAYAHILQF